MGKRVRILITCILIGLIVLFGAWLGGFSSVPARTTGTLVPGAGLSDSEAERLALEALKVGYTGTPTQMTVTQTTVGALDRFHCGRIGAMISVIVSPLQGNPDICAADSRVWVVSLYGEFHYETWTTDSVQVVLDRAGRMMAVDSSELRPAALPGY